MPFSQEERETPEFITPLASKLAGFKPVDYSYTVCGAYTAREGAVYKTCMTQMTDLDDLKHCIRTE